MTSLPRHNQGGFTLVELLVVLGIIVVLFTLTVVGLGKPQSTVSVSTTVDSLLADLRSQQLLSMVGDTSSGTSAQPHGIYVQPGQYTLFAGTTYSAGDSNNYVITAPQNITFATTFSGSTVLFNKGDGTVSGFLNGSNTLTVINATGGSKTITLNRLGVPGVN